MEPEPAVAALIDLTERRALVTGAARGIGTAVAARLSEAGAVVTMADADESVHAAAATLADAGGRVEPVRCDITDAAQVQAALDVACDGGSLDILVNNAGIYPTTGPILDVADDFVARMLEVNVRAQYSVAREAARRMGGGGSIVNMASIAGIKGGANITAYATSKAAVVGLTRAFAKELGPTGIRVNAIAPGIIDTPGVHEQMAQLRAGGLDVDATIAANPLGVAGHPDHVARAALFLCSDLAAFVTGHLLVVDGGAVI